MVNTREVKTAAVTEFQAHNTYIALPIDLKLFAIRNSSFVRAWMVNGQKFDSKITLILPTCRGPQGLGR